MECADVGLECSFFDAMLIFELFHGDLYILSELALLVLVDEQDVFDSAWKGMYFCL